MLKFRSSMLCTSKIHSSTLGNYLGTSLFIGNLIIIRVSSVGWNIDFAIVDEMEKNRMQKNII